MASRAVIQPLADNSKPTRRGGLTFSTKTASDYIKEYSGPFTIKHIGLCTQDGPEEKIGEMRFRISASSAELRATLLVAGVECAYSGRLSDFYTGTMNCPDRQPVPLRLWVK